MTRVCHIAGLFLRIGRITTAAVLTEYGVPRTNAAPQGITTGPDGSLWFGEYGAIGQAVLTSAGLSISPDAGTPGTEVQLSGSGFGADEPVSVFLDSTSSNLTVTATADSSGTFTIQTPQHFGAYGMHSLTAVGQASKRIGIAYFTVNAKLSVSPTLVLPGSAITIEGYGFGVSESVSINFDNRVTTNGAANHLGQFTVSAGNAVTIVVPPGTDAGTATVTASGVTSGATASAKITVE